MKRAKTRRAPSERPSGDRIQKVLAEAGLGSRREIERWIAEGRISVDGRRAELGERITGNERILINGRPVRLKRQAGAHRHLAYYKPSGEVTTRDDPEDRPTVFDRLPRPPHGRWITIGRLDLNTSGLLLLTTDGELAHRLMHPRYAVSREYAVRLLGAPSDEQLRTLSQGVVLDDGPAQFESIDVRGGSGRNTWLHVTLREGRNREVRRMFEAVGLTVSRLIRVRYGPVQLGRMQRGRTRDLTAGEIAALYDAVGLTPPQDAKDRTKAGEDVAPRSTRKVPRTARKGKAQPSRRRQR
ncbi:MAG TPA: pseudouridine synthase [Gammaproteobacteria bacterium]